VAGARAGRLRARSGAIAGECARMTIAMPCLPHLAGGLVEGYAAPISLAFLLLAQGSHLQQPPGSSKWFDERRPAHQPAQRSRLTRTQTWMPDVGVLLSAAMPTDEAAAGREMRNAAPNERLGGRGQASITMMHHASASWRGINGGSMSVTSEDRDRSSCREPH